MYVIPTFRSLLPWPAGGFFLVKPAVVDHLVGFLREGSSDEKLESLTEVVIPTNAGSLLRRTCSGMSEKEKNRNQSG